MGNPQGEQRESISDCFACGVSLASDVVEPIESYEPVVMEWLSGISESVMSATPNATELDNLNVMRHLALLLLSRHSTVKLYAHVCSELAVPPMALVQGKLAFESRVLVERHHVIQLIGWLMLDLERRLRGAWRARALRYNHMLKDFERVPQFYREIVDGCSNWRDI